MHTPSALTVDMAVASQPDQYGSNAEGTATFVRNSMKSDPPSPWNWGS